MIRTFHTRIAKHTLKLVVATLCLGIAGLAFSSMGGEKRKKSTKTIGTEFVPLKTSSGFTLKAGIPYKGSMILSQQKTSGLVRYNSLVTYQKGNTTYIVPLNHRVNFASGNDNTQMLRLKLRMHK